MIESLYSIIAFVSINLKRGTINGPLCGFVGAVRALARHYQPTAMPRRPPTKTWMGVVADQFAQVFLSAKG